MRKYFLAILILPAVSFGQAKKDLLLFIPGSLKVKSVLDSTNYIGTRPRLEILRHLS
jgi:hypothetical protein